MEPFSRGNSHLYNSLKGNSPPLHKSAAIRLPRPFSGSSVAILYIYPSHRGSMAPSPGVSGNRSERRIPGSGGDYRASDCLLHGIFCALSRGGFG